MNPLCCTSEYCFIIHRCTPTQFSQSNSGCARLGELAWHWHIHDDARRRALLVAQGWYCQEGRDSIHTGSNACSFISRFERATVSAKYNHDRAVFNPLSDLTASSFAERVKRVLSGDVFDAPCSINDAIEVYQCKLIIEVYSCFFDEVDVSDLRAAAKELYAQACSYTGKQLEQQSIGEIVDLVDLQYTSQFWAFLASANLWSKIAESELDSLMADHPMRLADVLHIPRVVKQFDECLCGVLPAALPCSAEIIIREWGMKGPAQSAITLPPSLSSEAIDRIMLSYLDDEHPNLNYVNVLAKWPKSSRGHYCPSPEVLVLAKRRSQELSEQLLGSGAEIKHSIGVAFSGEQRACKGAKVDGLDIVLTYGTDWLREYSDPETILNNFIFVFEVMGTDGLLSLPAHKHDNSTLLEAFSNRAFDEYPISSVFNYRQTQALLSVNGYDQILEADGKGIAHALEYAYNDYFPNELGISGFSISLPSKGASWLDKCKAIGPEIERVLKAAKLFCERGEIDDAYFPYILIKQLDSMPSLIEGKYAIPGLLFESRVAALFHDQSLLAFLENRESRHQEFYFHINNESVTREDFHELSRPMIDKLIADGFVIAGPDGILRPTNKTHVLKALWDNGAICLFRKSERYKRIVAELVEEGLISYSTAMFTPDEAAYLNYMFNDARFSNALALRNKYDHASFSVSDPNSVEYQWDYYRLLLLLIGITLKLNDDLSFALGHGGAEDFVDWPWIDDAMLPWDDLL